LILKIAFETGSLRRPVQNDNAIGGVNKFACRALQCTIRVESPIGCVKAFRRKADEILPR